MISAYEPFLGGLDAGLGASVDGGGVGCPFLNVDVAELGIPGRCPFELIFIFEIEEPTAEGLVASLTGREELADGGPVLRYLVYWPSEIVIGFALR